MLKLAARTIVAIVTGSLGAMALLQTWGYFTERTSGGLYALIFFWSAFAALVAIVLRLPRRK